jgi:parallel beta-helix repeat protein
MSITFPTFVDKEIPSPEKFNDFVQALEAKFTAGLGSAELQWPLLAAGNLSMSTYDITGGRKIWDVVNADEYTTFNAATVAGAGGVVFIPPNTTLEISGESLRGTVSAIIGSGPSSILRVSDAAIGGFLLQNNEMGATTAFYVGNLTMDGNSSTNGCGLRLRNVGRAVISNVHFKDFADAAIEITNNGTVGQSSRNVQIIGCSFSGGASNHIEVDDCYNLNIQGCIFNDCAMSCIDVDPAGATANAYNINVTGCQFDGAAASQCIDILGASGVAGHTSAYINVCDNTIRNSTGAAIRVGATTKIIQGMTIKGNTVRSAAGGISVWGTNGVVSGNTLVAVGSTGIDLNESTYVSVTDNIVQADTHTGIDASDCENCFISGNQVVTSGTAFALADNTNTVQNNTPNNLSLYTSTRTLTIPAGTLKIGDTIRAHAGMTCDSVTAGATVFRLDASTTNIATSGSTSSTNPRYIDVHMLVHSATGITYSGFGVVRAAASGVDNGKITSINIANDLDIKVVYSNSVTFFTGIFAEISHTQEV